MVGTLLMPEELRWHPRQGRQTSTVITATPSKDLSASGEPQHQWHDVLSLLTAIGSVTRRRDNKVAVTVGSETRLLNMPEHKDVDTDSVIELRRLLAAAGYGVGGGGSESEVPPCG